MNMQLPSNALFLAPMVEISHRPLRELIEYWGGCDIYHTEMISAAGFVSGSPWGKYFTDTLPVCNKTIIQFYTTSMDIMKKAASLSLKIEAAGIDLNFGCSAPKIEKAGGGVKWMKDINAASDLVKMVRDVRPSGSLSAKTRIGYEDDYSYLRDFCAALGEAGIDWIVLHPRLKKDRFRGTGKWNYIKQLVKDTNIPIIGNGDIRSPEDWYEKTKNCSPAGIMIGREAIKRPWIFALIKNRINNKDTIIEINLEEIIFKMLDLIERFLPAEFHLSRAIRFLQYFCANFKFAHHIRSKTNNSLNLMEIKKIVKTYFNEIPEDRVLIE